MSMYTVVLVKDEQADSEIFMTTLLSMTVLKIPILY